VRTRETAVLPDGDGWTVVHTVAEDPPGKVSHYRKRCTSLPEVMEAVSLFDRLDIMSGRWDAR
jgi:hypothetical protein